MALSAWSRSPVVRRHLATCALVLAAGGLVLSRSARAREDGSGARFWAVGTFGTTAPRGVHGPGARGSWALSHAIVGEGPFRLYADVSLRAEADGTTRERAPLSLAIVLDTSGSMEGEKLARAKDAVRDLLADMRDDDEVVLVRYADEAEIVQPLGSVRRARGSLLRRLESLRAGGGTRIPEGLRAALRALDAEGGERVRRVVLVSDGLDERRGEAQRLAHDAFERRVTVSSLGIGLDFDEAYLAGVATAGHGNFAFVSDDGEALARFLHRELDEAARTTVEDARVEVELPRGVRFVRAFGADARTSGGVVELSLGALFAGDERRVLLELESDLDDGAARRLAARAEWQYEGRRVRVDLPSLPVTASRDERRVEGGREPSVAARAASVLASQRQVEAAEAYAKGDVGTAERLVEASAAELRAAQAAAPAKVAAGLAAQLRSVDEAGASFRSAAPGSAKGREAAKRVVESETANAARARY